MNEYNKQMSKVLDIDYPLANFYNYSLKELYNNKKATLGISDRQIQKILGIDNKTLTPILEGTAKHINFTNIIKLSHFLGITVNDLTRLYLPDMNASQIGEIQRAKEAGYIVENFDVASLTKMKFFKTDNHSKDLSQKIIKFFHLDSIYNYSDNIPFSAFSSAKRDASELMRRFWVQSAFIQFKMIDNPNIYDRVALKELIPKIRPYTRNVKTGLISVIKALFQVGVTVIYQPSIEKLQVRGATMVVNGKPCVVLSDFQKNYPTLWFTLLHELYHVLFDFEEIAKRTYHISSGEGDLFLMDEERADNFAKDYLLNESRLNYATAYINSPYQIEKLANQWGIHSSIIYAIYCFQTKEWAFYNKYIPKMKEALELINTHPFERSSLLEAVKELKETIYI
jgi:putative plasmid maintenance system antidote protein|nr:MAG TPA: IrrE protein [Caudoviricetes sp.]